MIARNAGAIVYERYDETKKTKGFALDWFLGQKIEENAEYDGYTQNIVTIHTIASLSI